MISRGIRIVLGALNIQPLVRTLGKCRSRSIILQMRDCMNLLILKICVVGEKDSEWFSIDDLVQLDCEIGCGGLMLVA